jgi:anaerobic selenocysteine-containing dehydrogenase
MEKSSLIKRFGTCSKDCYGSCVFVGHWNDSNPICKLIQTTPSKTHPFTNGFLCPKLNNREKLLYHPQRLKNSLIRKGNKGKNHFHEISNEKAISITANKIREILRKFGPEAILVAFSSGNFGLISRYSPLRFFGKLGATITSEGICNEGGCAGLKQIFGTYSTTNPFQLSNPATSLIWIWGSDLSNRNNHAYHLVKKAKKNGAKLIVIDSRRTQIAMESDYFIYTIPGLDHLLAILIIIKLIENENIDHKFIEHHVEGFSSLLRQIQMFDVEEIKKIIKIDENQIDTLVELLRENKGHTIFNIGFGVQKDYFGGRIVQIISLIQILMGNIGSPGTGIIYSQSDFNRALLSPLIEYLTNIPSLESKTKVKIMELGPELESKKYKMLFTYNFNPASSLPNQNLVRQELSNKNLFIVSQELFLTQTTKYADIVIPSKFDLETPDLISPYYSPGISINYGGPCPYSNCLSNFGFFIKLAENLGWDDKIFKDSEAKLLKDCIDLLPSRIKKKLVIDGYYVLFGESDIPFKDLKFPTKNNKIQLENLLLNFGKEKKKMRKFNEFHLITPSHKYFLHSQLGQLHPNYSEVFNHVFLCKEDIKLLGLKDKKVIVFNKYGKGVYNVKESPALNTGTALIYSGSPFYNITNLNPNLFTPDIPEELGFSGAFNSAIVEIKKIE